MNGEIYGYSFHPDVEMQQVEEVLMLAVMAAEGLHGRSRVQLDATFNCDLTGRFCEVDASTEVGAAIARIFTALLTTTIGESAFKVERIIREEPE